MKSLDYFWRLHRRLRQRLPMWVIYRPVTAEYPGKWVARMHVALPDEKPTRYVITHTGLDALRTALPPGTVRLGRIAGDAPDIEEVWL